MGRRDPSGTMEIFYISVMIIAAQFNKFSKNHWLYMNEFCDIQVTLPES